MEKIKIAVELDAGETFVVAADQRDLAALEAADIPEGMFTRIRYLAWRAAKRAGRYAGTWEAWNTTDCVHAGDVPDGDEGEGEQRLDPGRKAPSDAA